ncbi:cell division protein FtsQ/DivIB [Paenibacillus sp. FSL W7-1287]|uniref:cell division protein FtsQ/DivIB n=1 Tax=Paenibacillus sp. FSL W7-1287 TaxID=2954538 RepID=UPI0030F76816
MLRSGQAMNTDLPVLKVPEPKKKSNKKLITIIVILFIALLIIVFFNSSLSKITEIQVTGAQFTSNAEIINDADLKVGDSFLFSSSKKIKESLLRNSSIQNVDVSKKFPGIVKINVQEYKVVAFELSENGDLIALLASGASVVTNSERMQIMDKPILTGWQSDDMNKKELMKQLSTIDNALLSDLSEISPIPSSAFPDRILIFTRTKFEVITAISLLREKVGTMNGVIESQAPGRLTLLLADTFVPFDIEAEEDESGNE